jgi:DNA repair protein RecN (Recombination protein N)
MLKTLLIHNFVLVEKLEISFETGLTALTGETGAGKSLIIDALQGVLGGKTSPDQIRQGADFAYIEAVFLAPVGVAAFLLAQGFDEVAPNSLLTISKTLHRSGSKSRLNGQLVSQNLIRELGELLMDSVGQHENQVLFREEDHLGLVDQLGGEEQALRVQTFATQWQKLCQLERERDARIQAAREFQLKQDFLSFQLQEIEEAELLPDEEEDLQAERERLRFGEKLMNTVRTARFALTDQEDRPAIYEQICGLTRQLEQMLRYDQALAPMVQLCETLSIQVEELSSELGDYAEALELNPQRLEEVEDRLDLLRKLKHKYNGSPSDILAHAEAIRQELAGMASAELELADLEAEIAVLQAENQVLAQALSATRQALVAQLTPLLETELKELGMEKARFEAELLPAELGATGQEKARFLLSSNPGEPLRPLSRIASGGEISRILLALKLILNHNAPVATLIFDEIDTGISGKTALAVSQKLARLAQHSQILCITHLPVIAAAAHQQLWIEKHSDADSTRVQIASLPTSDRIAKLAQMGNGQITDTTLESAREMVAHAQWYYHVVARAS